MKLIIQIPCYNEAGTLAETFHALPKSIEGISTIETLVIDDGSTDNTFALAHDLGVNHILRIPRNRGLANAFTNGLEEAVKQGADIIVNTDADNQYNADDIVNLVRSIIDDEADLAIGDRDVTNVPTFSYSKRVLQKAGSWFVGKAASLDTPDATSGFRALTREAALRTMVLSHYSYTLETLIQAGALNLKVAYVPVRTNSPTRPSRIMRSIPHFLSNAIPTILRAYTLYRPLRVFTVVGTVLLLLGLILGGRFIYLNYVLQQGTGYIQSLILTAVLLIVGFQILLIGLVADLISANRKILENVLYRVKKIELDESRTTPKSDTENVK